MGLLRDMHVYIYIWLMVLTILKNMKVNGKDYPIYYGKIKMVETTNQLCICVYINNYGYNYDYE